MEQKIDLGGCCLLSIIGIETWVKRQLFIFILKIVKKRSERSKKYYN
jgi:hypothetical protein